MDIKRNFSGSDTPYTALVARLKKDALSPDCPAARYQQMDAVKLLGVVQNHPGCTLGEIKRQVDRKATIAGLTGAAVLAGGALVSSVAYYSLNTLLAGCAFTPSNACVALAVSLCGFGALAGLNYASMYPYHIRCQEANDISAKLVKLGESMSATKPVALLTYNPGQRIFPSDLTPVADPVCVKVSTST